MKQKTDESGIRRRDVLAAGALSMVAAVASAASGAGQAAAGSAPPTARRQAERVIRVGIIGAGTNIQNVQIPGFRRQSGCELLAVANRSLDSSRRVASQFNIPRPYAHWQELLDDKDIDAVSIGTWPYMHRTLTLAALARGKHVLCQARMANNASEARDMLAAAREHPALVTQLVPMSQSYWQDKLLTQTIQEGRIGEVLSVDVQRVQTTRRELTGEGGFADRGGELSWRHSQQYFGLNALSVGQTYEELTRWLGPATRVMAMSKIHVPYRRGADKQLVAVDVADHIDVLYELVNNAQVHLRMSATSGLSAGNQTWIYGTEGTIHTDNQRRIFVGKRGDDALKEVANPREQQARYRVEEEFLNAIRGREEVRMNTFEMGVQNMEFVEAVYRSAKSGQAVNLPV